MSAATGRAAESTESWETASAGSWIPRPGLARLGPALAALLLLAALVAPAMAQGPDLGPVLAPLDEALGQTVPPALALAYNATGQNVTREDVRITLDLNFSKGDVNFLGLLLGSGKAEVQASLHGRLELRVISSERIRAAVEGENAYNMSAENATFLSEVFIPAEVFRATASAEVIAAFQRDQEAAMAEYLARSVPELEVLGLEFTWSNVHPQQALTDVSLTEPPIVLELDLVVQYIRVESIRSLLEAYFAAQGAPEEERERKESKKEYVQRIKAENGTPLQSRDFFAAAAYTQLLNLSMQPGWSLDVRMHLPRGYSFTYFNDEVEREGERGAALHVDARTADEDVHKVFLASITHRKMVAFALLATLFTAGLLAALPFRFLYGRLRLPRLAEMPDASGKRR